MLARNRHHSTSRTICHKLRFALVTAVLCLYLQPSSAQNTLGVQAYYAASESMLPTFKLNDRFLVSTEEFKQREPRFGEVVVFKAPSHLGNHDLVFRCMGLPGDTLYTRGRQLFRKAKGEKHFRKVSEAYVSWQAPEQAAFHSYDMKVVGGVVYAREHMIEGVSTLWTVDDVPVVKAKQRQIARAAPEPIPAGRYIMLGDCRNNAYDSHRWGFVSRQQLIGPVLFRYWPLWRLRAFSLNSR